MDELQAQVVARLPADKRDDIDPVKSLPTKKPRSRRSKNIIPIQSAPAQLKIGDPVNIEDLPYTIHKVTTRSL